MCLVSLHRNLLGRFPLVSAELLPLLVGQKLQRDTPWGRCLARVLTSKTVSGGSVGSVAVPSLLRSIYR